MAYRDKIKSMSDHYKTLNMQDKMEYDCFKPSEHDVIQLRCFENIQLQNSQHNLNLKSTNPTRSRNKNNCVFDKCTMQCIQNEKSLKHRHKETEFEI